ncbi:MAG: MFS transporter [Myxococcales bacterium]
MARRAIAALRLQWRVLTGNSRRSRFVLFGALYFAQGVPWGFFTVALQLRLTKLGLSPGALGEVMTLAWLPWAAKPLLGPLVDRVSFGRWGRRRPFVLLAEAGMAVSLMLLATADPASRLTLFSGLVFLHNVFAATQDVGVDALALDLLTPDERGRANGIMSAGQYGGMVVGGQGLIWVANHLGWPAAFGAAVVLLLLPATLVLGVREGPVPAQRLPLAPLLWRSFAVRVVILAVVFAFIFDLSDGLLTPMMFPLMQRQLGYSDQQVATLATLAGLMGVVGSLVGGALSDRLGRRWGLFVACLGVALTDFIFAGGRTSWGSYAFILVLGMAGAMATGMVSASSVAMFMDLTNRRLGATQFQVYMSVMNLRTSAAVYGGGHLADRTSPRAMFVLGGIVELLPLALLPLLDARRAQKAFAQTEITAASVDG